MIRCGNPEAHSLHHCGVTFGIDTNFLARFFEKFSVVVVKRDIADVLLVLVYCSKDLDAGSVL